MAGEKDECFIQAAHVRDPELLLAWKTHSPTSAVKDSTSIRAFFDMLLANEKGAYP